MIKKLAYITGFNKALAVYKIAANPATNTQRTLGLNTINGNPGASITPMSPTGLTTSMNNSSTAEMGTKPFSPLTQSANGAKQKF